MIEIDPKCISLLHFHRETLGTVFHQEKGHHQDHNQEVPCKKFKLEDQDQDSNHDPFEIEHHHRNPEQNTSSSSASVAFNLAARFLTARAQLIHQQALLQHKAALGLWPSSDNQQKLSQMLQIAQFQAYLASVASNAASENKTENGQATNSDDSQE